MLVRNTNKTLQRIDDDAEYDGEFGSSVATAFRNLMQLIRAVDHENDLRALKSRRFEKLKGKRGTSIRCGLTSSFA